MSERPETAVYLDIPTGAVWRLDFRTQMATAPDGTAMMFDAADFQRRLCAAFPLPSDTHAPLPSDPPPEEPSDA